MGQPVAVVEKPTARPGVVRFEANRSLTGMGHERFTDPDQAVGPRPAAELARRLFATGRVDAVHIYQNVVTVDLKKGFTTDGLADVLENLYIYWVPGREPPPLEIPAEEAPAAAAAEGDAPAVAARGVAGAGPPARAQPPGQGAAGRPRRRTEALRPRGAGLLPIEHLFDKRHADGGGARRPGGVGDGSRARPPGRPGPGARPRRRCRR